MATTAPRIAALVLGAALLTACSGGDHQRSISVSGEREGLSLEAKVSARGDSLFVEARVRNDRARPVYLDADQCGRVTEAVLARTKLEPEGRRWHGPLAAAKRYVVKDQVSRQGPDRFAPRIPGETSADPPPCVRPERPRRLRPGQEIAERWELPFGSSLGLAAVGSAATLVRVDVVEAKALDELDFLDILPTGAAEAVRAGRKVRVEQPVSAVLDRAPTDPPRGPSLGQLYDRMLASRRLRRWIEAQPVDGWRLVQLTPSYPGHEEADLHMITTGYERAAFVKARADGTTVSLDLPAAADRSRVFPRRPATLPAGIRVIPEPDGYELTHDILPGSLELPSGRVVVTELLDSKPLDLRVKPGRYPAYATLVTYENKFESVALATLVLSRARTVRWKRIGSVAVDGGSTSFYSAESAERMARDDTTDRDSLWNRVFDSRAAHDFLVTEFPLTPKLNVIEFSSGNGDGGYPILAGYDAAGRPARIVVDFYLLHLDWPGSS
ncbi:MAG TPA: DUF4241 domain-containing protein [Gaiellaceae bacterium]|nr:DUF4241 domain-containing protein [Gaiellaceae bacterium]